VTYDKACPKCEATVHQACLDQWVERQGNCPVCRKVLDESVEPERIDEYIPWDENDTDNEEESTDDEEEENEASAAETPEEAAARRAQEAEWAAARRAREAEQLAYDNQLEARFQQRVAEQVRRNEQIQQSNTALHTAVIEEDEDCRKRIQELVEGGAEVDAANLEGNTPLHMAAHLGNRFMCAKTLLQLGADAKARNRKGETPLHLAVHPSAPRDPPVREWDGWIRQRFDERQHTIYLLLEHGAQPNDTHGGELVSPADLVKKIRTPADPPGTRAYQEQEPFRDPNLHIPPAEWFWDSGDEEWQNMSRGRVRALSGPVVYDPPG
jgi:hypothetical protein